MSYTSKLLAGTKPGRIVPVYSSAPYENQAVEYAPRSKHDASPWILAQDVDGHSRNGFRFTGRECHLHTLRFTVEDAGRAGFAVMDTVDGHQVGDYISSRYAAKDAAQRYEAKPELAPQRTRVFTAVVVAPAGADPAAVEKERTASLTAAGMPVVGYNISVRKLAARLGCDLEAVLAAARRLMAADGLESVVAFYEDSGDTLTADAERIVLKQAAANRIHAELSA